MTSASGPARRCRRCELLEAASLPGLARAVVMLRPRSLVVDVEPLVAPWDSTDVAYQSGLDRMLEALLPVADSLQALVLTSNSRRSLEHVHTPPGIRVHTVSGARKPWLLKPYASLPRPAVVVGDQPLTDGMLAHRLGATFVLWSGMPDRRPAWPRMQRAVGLRVATPILFRRRRDSVES